MSRVSHFSLSKVKIHLTPRNDCVDFCFYAALLINQATAPIISLGRYLMLNFDAIRVSDLDCQL